MKCVRPLGEIKVHLVNVIKDATGLQLQDARLVESVLILLVAPLETPPVDQWPPPDLLPTLG